MTLEQVQQIVNDCLTLITVDGKGLNEARERAAKFLTANALLANYMHELEVELGKHETVTELAFSQAIQESDGKNIAEKKAHVIQNPLYRKELEMLKELEARKNWVKTQMKVLENAHLMFRQFARD